MLASSALQSAAAAATQAVPHLCAFDPKSDKVLLQAASGEASKTLGAIGTGTNKVSETIGTDELTGR